MLALVLGSTGAAHARTTRQVVPSSISFWTLRHGLTAGIVYGPNARLEGQLAVTNDGGRTWNIRWRGTAVWEVSAVPGTNEAWATISRPGPCAACPPDLLHTQDGGLTWQPGTKGISAPSFPTPRVGFALRPRLANAGPLMRTLDGGRTWHRLASPCRRGWGGYAWAGSVAFVSPQHGWLVCTGQPGAGNQSKAVYETVNGGAWWRRLLNVWFEPGRVHTGGLSRYGYASGISFSAGGRGLLWEGRGSSYLTSDRGRSWRPISVTSPDERVGLSGSFVSDRIAYLLVQDSGARLAFQLERTTDGGRTWHLVRSWSRR